MKFLYTILFLGFAIQVAAQQKQFTLQWGERDVSMPSDEVSKQVPGFQSEYFRYFPDQQQVIFETSWQESGNVSNYELVNVQYENLQASDLGDLATSNLPSSPNLQMETYRARSTSYISMRLNPILKTGSGYRRITAFQVQYSKTSGRTTDNLTSFSTPDVGNSVLAQGNWYRFYVQQSGVHRINRSFLQNLGMDVGAIDPRRIKIYGHGGEMLPLGNSENEDYDIPETAIQVVGGEDGSFDAQDYILFYGTAVNDEWNEESDTNLNLYADYSYYYITADGDLGQRVQNYIEPSGTASTTYTTYDAYQYYEVDQYNIANAGRRWLGDRFDVENEKSYEFTFENLVTSEPISYRFYGAAASDASTSLNFSINGEDQGTINLAAASGNIYGSGGQLLGETTVNSSTITVDVTYNNGGNPASLGYLDYINITAKQELRGIGRQFKFYNEDAALTSGIGEYVFQNASSISQVWDVTNRGNIRAIANENTQANFSFKTQLGENRTYIAIDPNDVYTPLRDNNASVENVNLKGTIFDDAQGQFQDVDYLMITSDLLLQQANRLADFRRNQDGLKVKVVLVDDIYTEFSSGKQDIAAIRNFIKYVYDNASSPANRVKYVCLFGDASVDYKNRLQNNNNIVPIHQRIASYSLGQSSTPSDDFYALMDANEGGSEFLPGMLDIAVGRILADSPQLARTLVDKIVAYDSKESYGSWRNSFVLISDDADNGDQQLQVDLDAVGDEISANKPFINVKKIHSDAFEQVSSAGGFRYPEVNEAITEAIEVGACVVNYYGHGGENNLAGERIVTIDGIQSWQNENRYNLFITVTCEFARFDNPIYLSPAEHNLFNTQGGSVAMVSTTREILVSAGRDFNNAFAPFLFDYNSEGYTVAEAVRRAKNESGDSRIRMISFLGDPAMKLALADPEIRLTQINDIPINSPQADTLKALSKVKLKGEVVYPNGSKITDYNGVLSTTIFDKRIDRQTLGNDGTQVNNELFIMDFTTLGETIFRGQASVNNGEFEFDFVVPKDIQIPVGNGRVSFYSERNQLLQDNRGYNNEVKVGGINTDAPEDNQGPEIQLYMNDESFVSGGITNASPILLAKLKDENGINTASGIGHDLVAILDGDETNPYVVNDYYETEVDDYTQGTVNYKLRDLEEGLHTLTFKAWDVYNNSSTAEIQFLVTGDNDLKITRVLNYPNPFTTYTEFWFNHNRPFEPLEVQVQVFTVTGKIVWTQNQVINTDGFLSREITWDGRDDFGNRIGKGVYVYKLSVKSTLTNKKVEKYEKLVIL